MVNKEHIFRQLYASKIERDAYFDSIPSDIAPVVWDNRYVTLLEGDYQILFEGLFGDDAESILWFLHEWRPGFEVGVGGMMTQINDIDQYIDWIKANEGFK